MVVLLTGGAGYIGSHTVVELLQAGYAEVSRAAELLNWRAKLSLEDMVRDTWRWQSNHPQGYNE